MTTDVPAPGVLGEPAGSSARADVAVFSAFVALTFALTYPMAWHLGDSIPGYPAEDNFHYLWELWYPAHAIFERHVSPFVDSSIFSPFGYDLIRNQDLSPATVLLFAPFTYVLGEVVTYNLIVLATFPLTAFGTYLLCRELWGSRPAAFVAGVAAGFCAYRVTHALGHLSLVNTQWIPFFLFYVERSIRNPSRWNGTLAGAFYSLTALVSWYYAVGCAISAMLYVSVRLSAGDRSMRDLLRPTAAAALVTLVLVVPFVIPYAYIVLAGDMTNRPVVEQETYSASVADFFIPSVSHPMWGQAVAKRWRTGANGQWLAEWQVYLGMVPLALAVLGVCASRTATVWALIAVGLGMSLMALGPTLQLTHSASVENTGDSWIWLLSLPVRVLSFIPPLSILRSWSRMAIFVELVVAVLAARGVLVLLNHVPRVLGGRALVWRVALTVFIVGLTVVDTLAVPYKRSSVEPRAVDKWLAAQPGDFATIDFPVMGHGSSGPAMYRRRVTGKPTVLGYGRHPPNLDFWGMLSRFPGPDALDVLQWWGVKYVLVDEARYRSGADFWGVRHTWTTLQPAIVDTGRLVERAAFNNVHVYELLPAEERAGGPELLPNPGFEASDDDVPVGWTRVGSRDEAVLKPSEYGRPQVIEVTPESYFISSRIPVSRGRCYEVQHVNRAGRSEDEARLQVNWLDESGRDLGASVALFRIFNGYPTWRRARAWGRAPMASRFARIYAAAHRGRVWLDDFSFREVDGECGNIVEGPAAAAMGNRDMPWLTATPNPVIASFGAGRTTVAWSTGKEPAGEVYMSENGGPEVLFAGLSGYGSQEAGWIGPGKSYEFRLYSGPDRKRLATVVVTTSSESTLFATPSPVPVGTGAGTTEIRWSTGDGSVGEVYVSIDNAPEVLFGRNSQGSQQATWIRAGSVYVFRLYRIDHTKALLASIEVRPASSKPDGGG